MVNSEAVNRLTLEVHRKGYIQLPDFAWMLSENWCQTVEAMKCFKRVVTKI